MAFQESVVITVDARQANRNLTTLEQRLSAVEQASRSVDSTIGSLNRSLQSGFSRSGADRQVDSLRASIDSLRTSVDRSSQSLQQLGGNESSRRIQQLTNRVNSLSNQLSTLRGSAASVSSELNNVSRGAQGAGTGLRNTRGIIQNVGFQLQDVAVQAQAGTNSLVILGQQAPQLLGAFGAVGAIAGAFVAIGAAAAGVLLPSILDNRNAAEQLQETYDALGENLVTAGDRVRGLSTRFNELSEVSTALAQIEIRAAQADTIRGFEQSTRAIADFVESASGIDSILTAGIETSLDAGRALSGAFSSARVESADLEQVVDRLTERVTLSQNTIVSNATETERVTARLAEGLGLTARQAAEVVTAVSQARGAAQTFDPLVDNVEDFRDTLFGALNAINQVQQQTSASNTEFADFSRQISETVRTLLQMADASVLNANALQSLGDGARTATAAISSAISSVETQIALQRQASEAGELSNRVQRVNNELISAGVDATRVASGALTQQEQVLRNRIIVQNNLIEAERAAEQGRQEAERQAQSRARQAEVRSRQAAAREQRANERAREAIANLSAESEATQAGTRELAIYRDTKSAIAAVEASSLPNKDRLIEQIREEAEAALDATDARREQAAEERRLDQLRTRAAREQEREAQRVERAYQRQFETINEGLADALLGYRSLRDVATSVAQDIARAFVRNQITGPLLQGLGLPGGTGQAAGAAPGSLSIGGIASSIGGLFTNAGQSVANTFFDFATSNIGQAIGLGRGVSIGGQAGLGLTGTGSFISRGLQFSPFGAVGGLLGNALGLGSGNPLIDTVTSTAGGIAGGSLGSTIGALGSLGGPLGAGLGALLGTALGGLFGGRPSDRTQALSLETETGRFVSRGLQGNRFSQENRTAADAIGQSLGALNAFLQQQTGRTPGTEIGVSVGDVRGLRLSQEGREIFRTQDREEFINRAQQAVAELFDVNVEFYRDLVNESETLGDAIIRINQQFTTVRSIADALGLSFAATGEAGQRAANQLVEAFGGQGQLTAAFQQFDQNFFTDEERRQRALEAAREQLNTFNNELGRSGEAAIDTRDEFRRYVQSLDLTTEAGSEAAATALRYQQAILAVDAATQQATNSEQERMTAINTARQEYIDAIREEGEVLSDTQRQLSDFARTLEATRRGLQTDSRLAALSPENQLALLRTQFEDVQRRAQLGDADAIAQLPQASRDFLGASREFYGQSEQYYRDFETVQQTLSNTQSVAERTASNAQMQLTSLNAQLEALGEQSNLLRTIAENTAAQARQATQAAATRFGNAVAGGAGGGSSASPTDLRQAVSALYTSGLGRAPDQAGLNFWVDQLRRGGNFNDVRRGFFAAAESNGEPIINRFQRGGSVRGPGTGTSDSIPAFVSNGEFVVRASSAQGNQGLLREINNDGGERLTAATEIGVEVNEQGFNDVVVELRAMRRELADMRRDNEALRANQR